MLAHRPAHSAFHRRQKRLDPSPHLIAEQHHPSHYRSIAPKRGSILETRPSCKELHKTETCCKSRASSLQRTAATSTVRRRACTHTVRTVRWLGGQRTSGSVRGRRAAAHRV